MRIERVDRTFAGAYDTAFAQLTADGKLALAFVRGCPQLICSIVVADAGPSASARTIAEMCPESGLATAVLPSQKVGTFRADVAIGAPARKADLITLEDVGFDITSLDQHRVTGAASQQTGSASVKGHFDASVCLVGGSTGQ